LILKSETEKFINTRCGVLKSFQKESPTTHTEGISTTITPRAGRTFNLGRWGNLSLFGGGNYLDTELTITETVGVEGFTIDYTVEQANTDKWNLLVGGNWDINKRLSWAVEYNGFIGSRDAFIMSLGWRF